MDAVKDAILPLISGVQIGKMGSVKNDAGLVLSSDGFEVTTSKGTSLICRNTYEYHVWWPVTVINTTVHVGCPKKANGKFLSIKGLAQRYCSEYDYWHRPVFRKCSSIEYQDILKEVKYI